MRKRMVNARTGEIRVVDVPDPGPLTPSSGRHWRSEAEGGPLHPFAPRDGATLIDLDELPKSLRIDDKHDHSDLSDLDGIDPNKSWADPRVNPRPWKRNIIGTAQHTANPTDGNGSGGGGTEPDLTTEPYLFPGGPETSAILIMLKAPASGAAVAAAGGFTVTVWVRDPGTHFWGATAPFSAAYDVVTGTGDFNGGELFFQITNVGTPGNVVALVKEQY